jgi:hypothetical protein
MGDDNFTLGFSTGNFTALYNVRGLDYSSLSLV